MPSYTSHVTPGQSSQARDIASVTTDGRMVLTGSVIIDLLDPFRVVAGVKVVDLHDVLCVVAGVTVVDLPNVLYCFR